MPKIDLTLEIDAPREKVFEVLTDHTSYPDFTPLRKAKLEKEGSPEPNGLGAIRALRLLGPAMREEVIGYDAPASFSYRALSGVPAKDHVGTVTLLDAGGGKTEMRYHVENKPLVPGTGPISAPIFRKAIGDLAKGVKKEAERRASAG